MIPAVKVGAISCLSLTILHLLAATAAAVGCAVANDTVYDTQHVPGLDPTAPLKLVEDTSSVAACCQLCSSEAGCLYFTFYPNQTCALLNTFGGPRVLAGAVSGSTITHPAPVSFVRHDDPSLLNALKALPRLPKPHFAWPILPTGDVGIYTTDPYVAQFTRICGSISFSAEFANRERTFLIVRAAATANATLGIHFWGMWKRVFPVEAPPTYNGPEAAAALARFEGLMQNASAWIDEANARCAHALPAGEIILPICTHLLDRRVSCYRNPTQVLHTRARWARDA